MKKGPLRLSAHENENTQGSALALFIFQREETGRAFTFHPFTGAAPRGPELTPGRLQALP